MLLRSGFFMFFISLINLRLRHNEKNNEYNCSGNNGF
jgi:hypothetical protein